MTRMSPWPRAESSTPSIARNAPGPWPKTDLPGTVIDYRLIDTLGSGGMGMVYEAVQTSMTRPVALKRMRRRLAANARHVALFEAEASTAACLDHPGIATAFEVGKDQNGIPFYTMHLVRGESWHRALKQQSEDDKLQTLLSVCDAVAFAHSRGIVHGDIKPDNVMLGAYGETLLMDWGVAIHLNASDKPSARGGTPCYMSPEQARSDGGLVDTRSDIYLLGATLFHTIEGVPPRDAVSLESAINQALAGTTREITQPGPLHEIAATAMAQSPEDRYQTIAEFANALTSYRQHAASRAQSTQGHELLNAGYQQNDYAAFQSARAAFAQAHITWPDNQDALNGEQQALSALVERAVSHGDLEFAASLLGPVEDDSPLGQTVAAAFAARQQQQRHLLWAKRIAVVLTVALCVVLVVALINREQARRHATACWLSETKPKPAESKVSAMPPRLW